MTRRISLITAVGAAFMLAVPAAWGRPAPDVVDRAVAQNQQQADFWNYESGTKITNASPGTMPQDLAQLYSGVGGAEPQWMQALKARSEALNRKHGLGEFAGIRALELRSEALNRQYGLGEYATNAIDARERALTLRSEALNRQHGLGEFATNPIDARERALVEKREVQLGSGTPPDAFERAVSAKGITETPIVGDDRFRIDPSTNPVPVSGTTTDSGREVEWPQIGIGFGVGIFLALGLLVAMRVTRHRPLVH